MTDIEADNKRYYDEHLAIAYRSLLLISMGYSGTTLLPDRLKSEELERALHSAVWAVGRIQGLRSDGQPYVARW